MGAGMIDDKLVMQFRGAAGKVFATPPFGNVAGYAAKNLTRRFRDFNGYLEALDKIVEHSLDTNITDLRQSYCFMLEHDPVISKPQPGTVAVGSYFKNELRATPVEVIRFAKALGREPYQLFILHKLDDLVFRIMPVA